MVEQQETPNNKKKGRSPSYPAIDLESALERADEIRRASGRHATAPEVIFKTWGYGSKSSQAIVALAALKKFGLTDDSGTGDGRRIKLSELALQILLDDRKDPTERRKAIRDAALSPKIHGKLWNQYGEELPDDNTLRYQLRMEEGFTDTASSEFIKQFRRTISFAGLTDSDTISGQEEDKIHEEQGKIMPAQETIRLERPNWNPHPLCGPKEIINIPIPLPSGKSILVQTSVRLSEQDWKQMMNILGAYKPSLVGDWPVVESQKKDEETE